MMSTRQKHCFRIFALFGLGLLALVLVALVSFGHVRVGSAQMGSGSPPPTYDYDATLPGTQPPTSLANWDRRGLRLLQLNIRVLVPLAELQALLPPGIKAIATPSGSNTAQVTLLFIFQQRFEQTGQTFGPFSGMTVIAFNVLNTNTMPERQENGILTFEVSDEAARDAFNANLGPGASRLAKTKVEMVEEDGKIRVKFDVRDEGIGLNVQAQAEGPAAITNRTKSDPASPGRFLVPNRSQQEVNQADFRNVPVASANAKVDTPGGRLNLPGGSLTILSLNPNANVTFLRNVEFFTKLE